MPEYGQHNAEEILEAYEAAVNRVRRANPFLAALIDQYVEDELGVEGPDG